MQTGITRPIAAIRGAFGKGFHARKKIILQ
jgi:hypothetical protein